MNHISGLSTSLIDYMWRRNENLGTPWKLIISLQLIVSGSKLHVNQIAKPIVINQNVSLPIKITFSAAPYT